MPASPSGRSSFFPGRGKCAVIEEEGPVLPSHSGFSGGAGVSVRPATCRCHQGLAHVSFVQDVSSQLLPLLCEGNG